MLSLALVFTACSETSVTEVTTDPSPKKDYAYIDSDGNSAYYYLDGEPVEYNDYESAYVQGQTVIVASDEVNEYGPESFSVHSFTDIEDYFNFSESVGGYARTYHAFDQKIADLNAQFDIVNEYERTGVIPEDYTTQSDELFADLKSEVLPASFLNGGTEKLLIRLYRDCSARGTAGGSFRPGNPSMPVMIFGLNNRVSMFGRFSIVSVNFVFDRSFYRRRFPEVTGSSIFDGFNNVRFCPGERLAFLDNRMSSGQFF